MYPPKHLRRIAKLYNKQQKAIRYHALLAAERKRLDELFVEMLVVAQKGGFELNVKEEEIPARVRKALQELGFYIRECNVATGYFYIIYWK